MTANEMTTETGKLPAMVEEGLAYFDGVGDDGDKLYVKAIREHIKALARDRAAQGDFWITPAEKLSADHEGYCVVARPGRAAAPADAVWLHYTSPPVAGDAPTLAEHPSSVEPDEKFGWKCNNCQTVFTAWKPERDPDDSNGGARCPYCKADGQYTYRCELHHGDPCNRCGTPHDEVKKGPCTGTPPAGDAQARVDEDAAFNEWIASTGLRIGSEVVGCMRSAWNTRAALAAAIQEKQP